MKNFRKTIAAAVVALSFAGVQSALASPAYSPEASQTETSVEKVTTLEGAQTSNIYIPLPPIKKPIEVKDNFNPVVLIPYVPDWH